MTDPIPQPPPSPAEPDPEGARDAGREALLRETAAPPPKKRRRWILRMALATPVALGLFVLLAPALLSTGPARRRIERHAADRLKRRVTIEDHSLSWFGPCTAEGFVIYEKDGTTPFLKIGKVSLEFGIRPLLDNKAVLEKAEVSGLEVRVVRRRDGTLSTDDIGRDPAPAGAAPSPAPAPPAPASTGKPWTFTLGPVALREAALTYVDEASGKTAAVTGLSLDAKPGGTADELAIELAAKLEATGVPPGTLKAAAKLQVLDGGRPRAETTGTASLRFEGLDLGALAAALRPQEGAEMRTGGCEGTMEVKLPAGGDREVTAELKAPAFAWGDAGQPPAVRSALAIRNVLVWKGSAHRLEFREGTRIRLDGADVQVQGSIDFPADERDTDNPVDLVVRFDGEMAHFDELFPASMTGQDHKGPLRSNWNIRGRNLDLLTVDGVAEVTSYIYTSHAEDGTASAYRVPHPGHLKTEAHGQVDLKRRDELAKADPKQPWGAMNGLTFDVEVRSPWIQSDTVDLKQVWIQLALRERALDMTRLEFLLNGGTVNGTGHFLFDQEDPAWTMAVNARGVEYSYKFSALAGLVNPLLYTTERGQLETKLSFGVDLKGRGFDAEKAKTAMAGKGTLGLDGGTIAGSPALSELYRQLKLGEAAKYSFTGMSQEFHIADGKIHNDWSKWQGEGKEADITLRGWTDFDMNLSQRITVEGDPTARWGKTTGAVIDVFNKAGGLPLGGTTDSPKIDIDYEKALKGAAGSLLDNPDLQKKGKSLLDDLLKKR